MLGWHSPMSNGAMAAILPSPGDFTVQDTTTAFIPLRVPRGVPSSLVDLFRISVTSSSMAVTISLGVLEFGLSKVVPSPVPVYG